jgi:hypothetical protein
VPWQGATARGTWTDASSERGMTAQRACAASVGRWPQERLEQVLSDPRVALSVLNLHLHSYKWVHRRLHQVVFEDDTTVRHSFTVDFTIPEQAPAISISSSNGVRLLPLDLLRKQSLVNFEIYDQAGRTLSFFTHAQLDVMAGTMLTKYAEGLLDESLPESIARCLRSLVSSNSEDFEKAKSEWDNNNFVNLHSRYIKKQTKQKGRVCKHSRTFNVELYSSCVYRSSAWYAPTDTLLPQS